MISVIVPLFNGGRYIRDCIRSVQAQTYPHTEILVVDDGSSDDGPERVRALAADSQGRVIRLLRHADNGNHGIGATRNVGLAESRGELIALLDQDDLWVPDKLARQLVALETGADAALAYGRIGFVDGTGDRRDLGGHGFAGTELAADPRRAFEDILMENVVPTLTVLVRRSNVLAAEGFVESPRHAYEDWLLLAKLAYDQRFVFVPDILGYRRIHDANYTTFRVRSKLDLAAEQHFLVTLFSDLMARDPTNRDRLERLLRRRIVRVLIRARAWGATNEDLVEMGRGLLAAFPWEERRITVMTRVLGWVLSPVAAKGLRKLRRRVVGL
jgi:glycosyltransferase involved in cell wall biosynthesis